MDKKIIKTINSEITAILSNAKNKEVLLLRRQGRTLDDIGLILGVTRERIRQIEIKPRDFLSQWMVNNKDILLSELCRNNIMIDKKAASVMGRDYFEIMKYIVETEIIEKKIWFYVKELDIIIYDETGRYLDVKESVLSKIKSEGGDIRTSVINIMRAYGYNFLTLENTEEYLNQNGFVTYNGKVMYGKMTIAKAIILAVMDYPGGKIRITNDKDLEQFAAILNNVYGLNVKPNRALSTRIQDILVMIDKAAYASIDKFHIEKETLDTIANAIETLKEAKISYSALYERFEKLLSQTSNITNEYMLHGILKYYEENYNYSCLRCYVSHGVEEQTRSAEYFKQLPELLLENGVMTEKEIIKEIPDWNKNYVKYAMTYFKEVVQWDTRKYFNMNYIKPEQEDLNTMKSILDELTSNSYNYCSSYSIYEKTVKEHPELLKKYGLETDKHVFYFCQYFITDGFKYRRPHIKKATDMEESFTTDSLLKEILGNRKIINKKEAIQEATEVYGSKNSSLSLSMQRVLSEYVRISRTDYTSKENILLTKSEKCKIYEELTKMADDFGVVEVSEHMDFSGFPKIEFEWNEFLLCEISDLFDIGFKKPVVKSNKSKHAPNNLIKIG